VQRACPQRVILIVVHVPKLDTLEDVLAWCRAHDCEVVDVVVQDEFTHDVIVRAHAPSFVVFDTT
jgi:hypothetical protein